MKLKTFLLLHMDTYATSLGGILSIEVTSPQKLGMNMLENLIF